MFVFTVVVTCNRVKLLDRALKSISRQRIQPNYVVVVSNSNTENQIIERELCETYNFDWIQNKRTTNYSGALNTGIEHFIKSNAIDNATYFSSLDDDDIWHDDYLKIIASNNANKDVVLTNLIRKNKNEKSYLKLPKQLSIHDFLSGNPGVGGSNTFVKLKTLLKAGCFDEAMEATVDRDLFVRLFQLKPSYKVIEKNLVTLFVENTRKRITNNLELKKASYKYFYYKYEHIMTFTDKNIFFSRAKKIFGVDEKEIIIPVQKSKNANTENLLFNGVKDFEFIIGFIAGDKKIAKRIVDSIIEKSIKIDKLVIIDNLSGIDGFAEVKQKLATVKINYTIVNNKEWKANLALGYYGDYFKKFNLINSIPIGRTILQHHLFTESISFKKPIYWVIDDDITFTNTTINTGSKTDVFSIINEYRTECDALIGSVSKDAPLPFLSSIRGQLIDLVYSSSTKNKVEFDFNNLKDLKDYYYDISDLHFKHLESPIYYASNEEQDLKAIFSGKSVSRPVLQKNESSPSKFVSNRGPNTLIFNRELLRFYPVVNLEVNDKFARRGDLLWVLLNQLISNRKIVEHPFCVDQNRPIKTFKIEQELDKSANDIIGYAFNKAIIKSVEEIKEKTNPNRPKDIYESLNDIYYFNVFFKEFEENLIKRETRFLMNYFRIIGLLSLLDHNNTLARKYYNQFTDVALEMFFFKVIRVSKNKMTLKQFMESLSTTIWSYTDSIKKNIETTDRNRQKIIKAFKTKKELVVLGEGSEGIVFTDYKFVYKSFYSIKDYEWAFLKKNKEIFSKCELLEAIDFVELTDGNFIKYPYHSFKSIDYVDEKQILYFLKFCKSNGFVFSNIKPINFIVINNNNLKLIDYGRSFEPYTEAKFINMTKRAFLMFKLPKMLDSDFRKLTAKINIGETPDEIKGWDSFSRKLDFTEGEKIKNNL